jgi:hypothetical protein
VLIIIIAIYAQVPRISALFVSLPTKSDDELYNISLKREPRGADRSAIA